MRVWGSRMKGFRFFPDLRVSQHAPDSLLALALDCRRDGFVSAALQSLPGQGPEASTFKKNPSPFIRQF